MLFFSLQFLDYQKLILKSFFFFCFIEIVEVFFFFKRPLFTPLEYHLYFIKRTLNQDNKHKRFILQRVNKANLISIKQTRPLEIPR